MPPLNLLCVEPSFPGRLGSVADWLVRKRGYRCWFAFHSAEPETGWPASVGAGLELVQFNVGGVARESIVGWQRHLERSLCYAYGAWEVIDVRRIRPVDAILARSAGLGSSLFLPVSYPRVPIIQRFDYFVQPNEFDLALDDGPLLPSEYRQWRRSANAMELLELENGVHPWTTSAWQRSLFPPEYRSGFYVSGEGIDTKVWAPANDRPRAIAGRALDDTTLVVTFVASQLDRLRGFDRFAGLAAELLRAREDVVCVCAGSPTVTRSLDVRDFGQNVSESLLSRAGLTGHDRFWNLGVLSRAGVRSLLTRSDLHIYPSRNYPIARSLLQALACGVPVVACDAPPVKELAALGLGDTALCTSGENGEELSANALELMGDASRREALSRAARAAVQARFDRDSLLPRLAAYIEERAIDA